MGTTAKRSAHKEGVEMYRGRDYHSKAQWLATEYQYAELVRIRRVGTPQERVGPSNVIIRAAVGGPLRWAVGDSDFGQLLAFGIKG